MANITVMHKGRPMGSLPDVLDQVMAAMSKAFEEMVPGPA